MSRGTLWHGIALVVIVVATALNAYLLRALDVIGIPFVFATALLAQLLLIILFVYSLVVFLRTPLRIAVSILASAFEGALGNSYVLGFRERHPRLTDWVAARFSTLRPTGLYRTVGTIAVIAALVAFLNVVVAVLGGGSLSGIDQRILNLVPSIRSPEENAFFASVTFSASWMGVLVFLLALALVCWLRRQGRLLALFVGASALEELVSTAVKLVVRRPRPDRWLALVDSHTYSFPSGHSLAAMVLGGLAAYLIARSLRRPLARLAIALLAVVWVVLVGLSRVYLGAHYPSDVLGSYGLGAAILAAVVAALELDRRYGVFGRARLGAVIQRGPKQPHAQLPSPKQPDAPQPRPKQPHAPQPRPKQPRPNLPSPKQPVIIGAAAALVAAAALGVLLTPLTTVPHENDVTALPALDEAAVQRLPHYSETLTGAKMEPINFVFEGSQEQLEALFKRGGWYRADPSTPSNTLRAFGVALQGAQYLTAPVTPSYLDEQPETIAFEKATAANTLVQRHHTRIWKTRFAVGGEPLWVATASFDRGIGFGNGGLPTHHIEPNVDAERAYILGTLGFAQPELLHVVDAELGHNASGDAFFTDGRAAVVDAARPGT